MDSKKQHGTMKEKPKLKTTFSVPLKKSDACNQGTTNEPKAKHKATRTENRLHLSSKGVLNEKQAMEPDQMATTANADKQKLTGKPKKRKSDDTLENKENVTQTGKKKHKKALPKNIFSGDTLQSTEQQDGVIFSSDADSVSRTIAEVIGRTEETNKNTSDDSQTFDENDVDNWDMKDTGDCETDCEPSLEGRHTNSCLETVNKKVKQEDMNECDRGDEQSASISYSDQKQNGDQFEKSNRDKHSEERQLNRVKSKKMSQSESAGNNLWTPKSPQLIGNVSSDLSTGDEDSININDDQGEETGTWVECSNKVCKKWRYLADVEDPVVIPENWDCTMNSDKEHNSCDKPQEKYEDSGHIYTKYTNGSVVWARVDGYPWWPAMVECDPDTNMYYEATSLSPMVPFQYHVSFFDDQVTRSWVRTDCVKPYKGEMPNTSISKSYIVLKKWIKAAMKNAERAFTLPIKNRLEIYGFRTRFSSKKSFKKEKRTTLHCSAKHSFVKSESPDYTHGVHTSASVRGCEPSIKKNLTKRRPLVNRIINDQAEQSKVCTPSNVQSDAITNTSNTSVAILPDKLSNTVSSLGNNNIKVDHNNRNCDEKENNVDGSVDKAEKWAPDKKRKHQKQKLHYADDGDKHNKRFMLKESNTNIPDGTENNIKKKKSAVDSSETLEKYNLNNQLHKTDRHELIKKPKLTDKKRRQTQKHKTIMQDCSENVLQVQNTKTEEIRSHKKQNDNVEFSATVKTSKCSKKLEKVCRAKQQAAVSELSSCRKEEEIKTKITVDKHNESTVMIAEKKSDRENPLESKEVHINDSYESTTLEPVVKSKTGMKEVTETVDFGHRERDSKVRKCTNIVTSTTALHRITICNPTNSVTFTDSRELCAGDSLGLDDRKTVVTDQQVVPDMGTEMITNCKSCPDLAFSSLSEKSVKSEITDHLVAKTLPDHSCESENIWGFDSAKLGVNCLQKILNDDDSLDDNADDMILDLDESIEGVALAETNTGYSLHDSLRGDSFYEFESARDVDFTEL